MLLTFVIPKREMVTLKITGFKLALPPPISRFQRNINSGRDNCFLKR